jgi:hypothetical protein
MNSWITTNSNLIQQGIDGLGIQSLDGINKHGLVENSGQKPKVNWTFNGQQEG